MTFISSWCQCDLYAIHNLSVNLPVALLNALLHA